MENLEHAEAERRRRRRPYGNQQPTLHGLRAGCEAFTGSTETWRKHLHYGWFETQQQIYSWFRTHRERLTRTAFETTSRCFRRSHRCQTDSWHLSTSDAPLAALDGPRQRSEHRASRQTARLEDRQGATKSSGRDAPRHRTFRKRLRATPTWEEGSMMRRWKASNGTASVPSSGVRMAWHT